MEDYDDWNGTLTLADRVSEYTLLFSYGYLPFNALVTIIVDVSILVHLRRLKPDRLPKSIVGAIFILKLSNFLDLFNMLAPITQWMYFFVKPNAFSCKVLQFFAREPYTIAEWCCAIFPFERTSQRIAGGEYNKYFGVIRLKLGFGLFALVLGAAYTNYMWMYGIYPDIGHCLVLSEFGEAYYHYIVFTEPVVEFLLPQIIACIGLVLLVFTAIKKCRQQQTYLTHRDQQICRSAWDKYLDLCCVSLCLSNILFEGPKNVTRLISIIVEDQVLSNYVHLFYVIAVSRFPFRGCLILLILKLLSRRLRRNDILLQMANQTAV